MVDTTGAARTLLIVEDDADTGVTFQMLLERLGYKVHVTRRAASALAVLRRTDIDVVLCDLGLPDMSGLELMAAIRHDPDLRHLPVVAMTGFGQAKDREETAAAGFAAHLVKPVDLPVLQATLRHVTTHTSRLPLRVPSIGKSEASSQ